MLWRTRDGRILTLGEMTDLHLSNAQNQCLESRDHASCEAIWLEQERRRKASQEAAREACLYCKNDMNLIVDELAAMGFKAVRKQFVCQCGARGPYLP